MSFARVDDGSIMLIFPNAKIHYHRRHCAESRYDATDPFFCKYYGAKHFIYFIYLFQIFSNTFYPTSAVPVWV